MIKVTLGCSGRPGSSFPPLPCTNLAQVRLETHGSGKWKRPMCVDCAEAFELHCEQEGLEQPLFSVIEDANTESEDP